MELSRVLSAFAKNGIKVEKADPFRHASCRYTASKGDNSVTFYENGAGSGQITHFTWHSPHTDSMRDYFCDSYYDTIKSVVHFLNPSGELVKVEKPSHFVPMEPIKVANVTVRRNEERGGIEILFPDKPSADVRSAMKDKGFKYSAFNSVWWRKYSDADYQWAMETFANEVEAV